MNYAHLLQKCKNEIIFITLCEDDFDNVVFKGTQYELNNILNDDQYLQLIGREVVEFKIDGTCLIIVLAR